MATLMTPHLRKIALTAHVTASVGWLGAVAAFLALALTGLDEAGAGAGLGPWAAMRAIGWYVIVPLSLATLITGVLQALGTPWGLLRHYWVTIKLVITVLATALLLLHMRVVDLAARTTTDGGDPHALRVQLVVDATAAVAALLVTVVLSVLKPRGLTRRGRRAASPPRRPADGVLTVG